MKKYIWTTFHQQSRMNRAICIEMLSHMSLLQSEDFVVIGYY